MNDYLKNNFKKEWKKYALVHSIFLLNFVLLFVLTFVYADGGMPRLIVNYALFVLLVLPPIWILWSAWDKSHIHFLISSCFLVGGAIGLYGGFLLGSNADNIFGALLYLG